MQRDIWTRIKSRKFLLAVANALFIFLNEVIGQPVDPELYWQVTMAVIAFIIGESIVDAQAVKK